MNRVDPYELAHLGGIQIIFKVPVVFIKLHFLFYASGAILVDKPVSCLWHEPVLSSIMKYTQSINTDCLVEEDAQIHCMHLPKTARDYGLLQKDLQSKDIHLNKSLVTHAIYLYLFYIWYTILHQNRTRVRF